SRGANEIWVPAAQITDAPRYAWRGLSLDVARTFFTVGEIRRVIDLLELYKLNVLHLHLTDDQAWPLALGRPAAGPEPGAPFYRDEDLRDLVGYAADEPRGMPDEVYASYVRRLRRLVRILGKQPVGWQESARAGLDPDDVVQLWLT